MALEILELAIMHRGRGCNMGLPVRPGEGQSQAKKYQHHQDS